MDSPIGLTTGPVILTVPKCLYNFGTVSKGRPLCPDTIVVSLTLLYNNGPCVPEIFFRRGVLRKAAEAYWTVR